ncbi:MULTISPECIES: hypothetical protein [Ralstonia solanacearum species complex]|uniref:Uncharacterized protein n=3 Tax=Ralstonia solanacearum species complex TaxID=3116862 RepID=A0AAD0S8I1_RALSL|nr:MULTISPECIES: hypothetical protein [Ralstonia solanacearum species complex]BEU70724.1 hypothetical protein MAFF211271_02790 [Ralstonia pseudosolanacearum]AMP39029.1 hypothetical protein LBM2029_01670 [Ralstonia solanacearum]AXV78435.1 hypothetical protein CJO76_01400 [Ralstonia solanacearum]AXV83051.1 hypothetical protein CJO77_01430 [Ralstonia solanacearum]AXV87864.1 hypothetical protein CJO78_01755 [Ralstonia solanacearum]
MRLKQIGMAALLAAGALTAGAAWAQATRIEVFGQAARQARDVYTDGARTGRFDPYTEGMRSDPAGRAREAGGTVYGYPVPN